MERQPVMSARLSMTTPTWMRFMPPLPKTRQRTTTAWSSPTGNSRDADAIRGNVPEKPTADQSTSHRLVAVTV